MFSSTWKIVLWITLGLAVVGVSIFLIVKYAILSKKEDVVRSTGDDDGRPRGIVFGSSTTAYMIDGKNWIDCVGATKGINFKVYGYPGYTSFQALPKQDQILAENNRADTIIIFLGSNDSYTTIDMFESNKLRLKASLETIIFKFRTKYPTTPITLVGAQWAVTDAQTNMFRKGMRDTTEAVARNHGLKFVDAWQVTYERPELLLPDGLHFSALGQQQICQAVLAKI